MKCILYVNVFMCSQTPIIQRIHIVQYILFSLAVALLKQHYTVDFTCPLMHSYALMCV